jgi:CRISPR/Cas system-associated exonuclease Cas4 (RecB family)
LPKILFDYPTFVKHITILMEPVPFLKEIASFLLKPDAYHLPDTCLVFPNKRARLYLSRYIGEITDKPVWAPQYLTISELMEKASGYLNADRLTLLFELYKVYNKIAGSQENFDAFYPYSETLLADFDEIDKYRIDADDLFNNLAGLKSLDGRFSYLTDEQIALIRRFWNTFDPESTSADQKTFLSLWKLLPDVYREFKNRLHEQHLAYEGMAYRKAIEHITGSSENNSLECHKYLFIGFNALNACEEKLFRHLKNLGRAEFFWDYDSWYVDDEIHEAGHFMRRNLKSFPQSKSISSTNFLNNKKIYFVPVSSNAGQAGALPFIFNTLGISAQKDKEHTALVMADENLLIPVLYALPADISEVNVTMGYPLSGSVVFNLVDTLFELGRNSKQGKQGITRWYFKDVLAVLGNPLLKPFYHEWAEKTRQKVIEQNLVFIQVADIFGDQRKDPVFMDLSDGTNACQYLLDIITMIIREMAIKQEDKRSSERLQLEMLFQVYTFLVRLQDLLASQGLIPGNEVLFRLIRKMLRTMRLPFSGEPLAGLQVLGLLETRTLDFDNVILLSANEGIIPKAAESPSFIPHSLRAGFGLPTVEHYDSIAAYYFYRLIQRATKVALVYDSSSGGMRTGERSRFLHQLCYEMPQPPMEITPPTSISLVPVKSIVIQKTGRVAELLLKYTETNGKLLSPSAINEFLNCPLKFYFHHLLGLPQPDEVIEEIDARMFGNLLHQAMKNLYSGFGNLLITREKLESLLKAGDLIDSALDRAFDEILFVNRKKNQNLKAEGYNLIIRQVIRTYIVQLIQAEMKYTPFSIKSLEEKYVASITITVDGIHRELQIGGIVDRIDVHQDNIVILDYKTGSVKNTFTSIDELFDAGGKLRNDAVFQVFLYAHVYTIIHPGGIIVPGLYFIRNSHSGDFSYYILQGSKRAPVADYNSVKQEFGDYLQRHLIRLFNTEEPFTQTEDLRLCTNCAYNGICRK